MTSKCVYCAYARSHDYFADFHHLLQHLDQFPADLGKVSDENGERVHQQMKNIKERFKGKSSASMLADSVWFYYDEYEEET